MRNSGRHILSPPWATSVFCLVRLWRRVRWVISGQHIRNETAEPGRAGGLAHLDKGRGVGVWGLPLSSVNNLEAGTLFALDPVLPIGVRLDQAGVDRKAVPTAAPRQCSAAALFSNNRRRRSLWRKRPWRFLEKVE